MDGCKYSISYCHSTVVQCTVLEDCVNSSNHRSIVIQLSHHTSSTIVRTTRDWWSGWGCSIDVARLYDVWFKTRPRRFHPWALDVVSRDMLVQYVGPPFTRRNAIEWTGSRTMSRPGPDAHGSGTLTKQPNYVHHGRQEMCPCRSLITQVKPHLLEYTSITAFNNPNTIRSCTAFSDHSSLKYRTQPADSPLARTRPEIYRFICFQMLQFPYRFEKRQKM